MFLATSLSKLLLKTLLYFGLEILPDALHDINLAFVSGKKKQVKYVNIIHCKYISTIINKPNIYCHL